MKTIYLATFILIAFINIAYSYWIPRNTNVNACDNIINYVTYSDEKFVNYSDVKACYESIPYNKTKATQIIEAVKENFEAFYVLLEQSKEDPNPGFAFRSMDIIPELDLLLKNNYLYEYQFIYDLANLIGELRDRHTWLTSTDYHQYMFHQGLSLYSQIKVFNDIKDSSTIDCQVVYIDDKPAIDVITEFASNNTAWSRDLSVRFNSALASLYFGYGDFGIYGQLFTRRSQLPKNSSISYTLNCNDKITKIIREWQIHIKTLPQYKSPYINGTTVGDAKLIFDAFIARFYTLQDFGVVLILTEEVDDDEDDNVLEYHYITDIIFGLKLLADKGIKKIVLDLSNNGGGNIVVAHIINKILFPNIQNFPVDMKVNNISIQLIEGVSMNKSEIGDIFHYKSYISTKTNSSFNSINDFIGNNSYTRGGIQLKYTSKAFSNDTTSTFGSLTLPTPPKFPWNEKDFIILTNGQCISSCAILSQRLAEINVSTVSVGGFPNRRFSFASTSGGAQLTTNSFQSYFKLLKNIDNSLISKLTLPQNLTLSFTAFEAYSVNHPNEVLDFSFRPADYQLYYDERSARDPSKLWIQAVEFIR
ncbi:20743_t:CDS:2 [Dentiscutata erythropus]|uniref:20743_t:CDS:1 n=1 Tax=Dentiscutata erythropus TaxID=1348616 RepID=A0A9N9BEV4_9GLOM|nr:20743_t:CDS:2 [Dentiscutata erythropus]